MPDDLSQLHEQHAELVKAHNRLQEQYAEAKDEVRTLQAGKAQAAQTFAQLQADYNRLHASVRSSTAFFFFVGRDSCATLCDKIIVDSHKTRSPSSWPRSMNCLRKTPTRLPRTRRRYGLTHWNVSPAKGHLLFVADLCTHMPFFQLVNTPSSVALSWQRSTRRLWDKATPKHRQWWRAG